MGSGSQVTSYLIGKEATWGTGVSTGSAIGLVQDVGNTYEREPIEIMSIGQIEAIANDAGVESGSHTVTATYQHGRIFEFVLGESTVAATSSDYTHTFTNLIDDEPKSFSVSTGQNLSGGDVGFKYTGCMIESAELSIELNDVLKLSYTAKSKAPTILSTVPPAVFDAPAPLGHDLVTISLNGSAATQVQDFKIEFAKTTEPVNGLGTAQHVSMVSSSLKISFNGTLAFDDGTFHDHMAANDVTAITFVADNGTTLGSGKVACNIALQDIEVSSFEVTSTQGAVVFITLSGVARLNTMTTVDTLATY